MHFLLPLLSHFVFDVMFYILLFCVFCNYLLECLCYTNLSFNLHSNFLSGWTTAFIIHLPVPVRIFLSYIFLFLAVAFSFLLKENFNVSCKVSVQFSSAVQSCPTLCDSMDCSMPGFPVHHQLPVLAQTHVHWIGDGIQPSHPLSSPSPPAFNLSQHQGLF